METKDIILELRKKINYHKMNLLKKSWYPGKPYPVGKMEKQFQILNS